MINKNTSPDKKHFYFLLTKVLQHYKRIGTCVSQNCSFFLVSLLLVCAGAGALLAHMNARAEASPSPYLFSGNTVRMKVDSSYVTGEHVTDSDDIELVKDMLAAKSTGPSIRQDVCYTFLSSQNASVGNRQILLPRGLVSFGDGTVSIMTDGGPAPVSLTASTNSLLPPFVFGYGHENSPSPQLTSYVFNSVGFNSDHFTHESTPTSSYLSAFQCAIQPETKRKKLPSFTHDFGLLTKTNVPNIRQLKYRQVVERYAAKYNIAPELVLGIIKTESDFNPYAVSPSRALGLMQIVPSTAGGEVHSYLTGKDSLPSADLLFQPEKNIQYGTVYLHLLNTRYFQGVFSVASRKLLIIAAYNGGPGAVLKVFHQDPGTAISIVNSLTPNQVYEELTQKMPRQESRLYVNRVLDSMQGFFEPL